MPQGSAALGSDVQCKTPSYLLKAGFLPVQIKLALGVTVSCAIELVCVILNQTPCFRWLEATVMLSLLDRSDPRCLVVGTANVCLRSVGHWPARGQQGVVWVFLEHHVSTW